MAGFPAARTTELQAIPYDGGAESDPRNTFGQPGSLDLPPALRGRAGGGIVSEQDRQRTLGSYDYNAQQDAATGGGIPTPGNPRGGVPGGGDAIFGAQNMRPATPGMNWLSNGKREAVDPVTLQSAKATLLGANGLVPGRTYSNDTLAKASPEQIMQEVANMGQRVSVGKLQQEAAGKRTELGAWKATQQTPGTPTPTVLDPDHAAAVIKAAGNVLGSTGNLGLATQIHAIAQPSSDWYNAHPGYNADGSSQLGDKPAIAPAPLPSDNSAPAAPPPSPLDAAQQTADRARETLNNYSALAGENASPEHLRLLTQQHNDAREVLAAAKAEDNRQRDRAEAMADKYGIPFDGSKPGAQLQSDVSQQAQKIHGQYVKQATAASAALRTINNQFDQIQTKLDELERTATLTPEETTKAQADNPEMSAEAAVAKAQAARTKEVAAQQKKLTADQNALKSQAREQTSLLEKAHSFNAFEEDNPLGVSAPTVGSVSISDVVPNLNASSQGAGWLSPAQAAMLPSGSTFTGTDGITRTKH